eukprot:TRINITY_DN2152_c0_g1_i6.p1 TRINITY_DN2152_c0_g1~~TRINITY_DN2152_c0_g1_i6.p1  ORF type:complete len:417 (+),score=109.42 TRINITY_DN2152_c0_g1_i6:70-1320(+)
MATGFQTISNVHGLWSPAVHGCNMIAREFPRCRVRCLLQYQRFVPKAAKKMKKEDSHSKEVYNVSKSQQLLSKQNIKGFGKEPDGSKMLLSLEVRKKGNENLDPKFDQRLQSIRRSALEKKKAEEQKRYQPIDYDAPISNPEGTSVGLGAKVGIGFAVIAFGFVFAFGDFLPSGSEKNVEKKELTTEERSNIQMRLQKFEETLSSSPENPDALEGAAVAHAELGEYKKALPLLEKLTQESSNNLNAFRLLGDVRYELKDYEQSAVAYRTSLKMSDKLLIGSIRGLTNALLAAQKPDQAVQDLLTIKNQLLGQEKMGRSNVDTKEKSEQTSKTEEIDPLQIDLLLGKAYSDWGHIGDALAVYDGLISKYPEDFRGYLAKGILLKNNGKVGDAERMFIQARYFAPKNAKSLVNRYSGR